MSLVSEISGKIASPLLSVNYTATVPSLSPSLASNDNLLVRELDAFVTNALTLNVMISLLNTRGNSE